MQYDIKKEFKVNAKTQKQLQLKYKEIQDEVEKFRLEISASEILKLNIPFRDKVIKQFKVEKILDLLICFYQAIFTCLSIVYLVRDKENLSWLFMDFRTGK